MRYPVPEQSTRIQKGSGEMKRIQDQFVMLMFMDLVEHGLLTMEEAELAEQYYFKKAGTTFPDGGNDDEAA